MIETNLPSPNISIPNLIYKNKFNLDENIKVNVNYNKSSDEIYYSLVLFYKYKKVAVKNFYYSTFRF